MSDTTDTGLLGFVMGRGFFQQTLLVVILVIILVVIAMTLEYLYIAYVKIGSSTIQIMPYTISSEDKSYTFPQDPSKMGAKQLKLSDNEKTGIEFTYSMYMYVNPSTFTGEKKLYHVMHKGYNTPWPLMGPGVFLRGDTNTLRVVMNTYDQPYTYLDIDNIPVRKWFHVAIVIRKNTLEVYINGNLRSKLGFEGTLPYQNFQDLHLFSNTKMTLQSSLIPSIPQGEAIEFDGAFRGNISNLQYLAYAATFTEIQALMNLGVAAKTLTADKDVPPYLIDTYWATSYQQTA